MGYIITFLLAIINAMLINNVTLSRFYGICPFLGVSKKTSSALGMGVAVTLVIILASAICWPIYQLLKLAGIQFMDTITYILVIASLVQLIEMIIKKYSPSLYKSLGVYLPLITTNCAVLGVAILSAGTYPVLVDGVVSGISLLEWFLNGIFSGAGFTLAIVLLAGIRERMNLELVPKAFRGFPITLITAAIMSMAFSAFSGLVG